MIQINLIRVSPDSKYLEISVECDINYKFNKLNIKKYDWETTDNYPQNSQGWIDGSTLYYEAEDQTKQIMRVATSIFGGSTMFYFEFGVEWIGEGTEPLLQDGTKQSNLTDTAVCSDINNIYMGMLTQLLNLTTNCVTLPEDLKIKFVILYAHQEAMRLGRLLEAENFYDILRNNYTNCSNDIRSNVNSCGC